MNNVQLFFKYFGAQLRADRRQFMLILLSTLIIIAAYYIFCASLTGLDKEAIMGASSIVFTISLFVTSIVAVSKSFRDYHRPLIATRAMMLPVSRAQKFLYILLTYLIIVPVGLYGVYSVQDITAYAILGLPISFDGLFVGSVISTSGFMDNFSEFDGLYSNIYLEFFFQSVYFMVCAVVFRRLQFLFAILISIGFGLCMVSGVFFVVSSGGLMQDFADWATDFVVTYSMLTSLALTALFFAIAWFRFNSLQLKK